MPHVLTTRLAPSSDTFKENRDTMLSALSELDEQLALVKAGGGEHYVQRHRNRGKMLARERIELLLDRDSAFLELCPLSAWGTQFAVGASSVLGIGVVNGVECLITASDPTVKGGASNPFTMKKTFRGADIAMENRLPTINLVESGEQTGRMASLPPVSGPRPSCVRLHWLPRRKEPLWIPHSGEQR